MSEKGNDRSSCSNWRKANREGSSSDGNRGEPSHQNKKRHNIESNWRLKGEERPDTCSKNYSKSFEGYWSFRVEDDEKETFIEVLQKLHNDNPNLFIKPPYQLLHKNKGLSVISCTTADYRDVNAVANVVKIIHNVVDHPYGVLYYHKENPKYFFMQNVLFKITRIGKGAVSYVRVETSISLPEKIDGISLDEKDDDISTDLPSKVTDRECLFYPSESTLDNLPSRAGKWILYGSKDLQKMDSYWKKLKLLCDRGVIAALKSSTAVDPREGVIKAYTINSENMEEVSLAGSAIIEETGYDELLCYKTNEASKKGKYSNKRKKDLSLYLHAGKSRFCFRDEFHRWKLLYSE